jgi:hypothetical protein
MPIINVMLGGKTVWDGDIPRVEGGEPGTMDTDLLERRESVLDNDNEHTVATEYWLDGELVHRSVAMELKTGLFGEGFQATF